NGPCASWHRWRESPPPGFSSFWSETARREARAAGGNAEFKEGQAMNTSSEELIDRAWEAFDEENYDEAEACARRALLIEPDSIEARLAAARSLINLEEYEGAIPLLRESAALEPGDSETRTFLGIALFESCRFAEALVELRLAIDLGADSPDASYWL